MEDTKQAGVIQEESTSRAGDVGGPDKLPGMSAAQHTPGPWVAEERFDSDGETSLGLAIYAGRQEVARLPGIGQQDFADAQRIVQCVNAHDDLVAALKRARRAVVIYAPGSTNIKMIDAAIAKATGAAQ